MEHKNSGLRLKDDLNREEIRVSEAVKPLRRQRQEVVEAENYLQTLMRNRNRQQQENGFPHNIERLTRAVAEENSFARKPIGPLGSHITLTKPLWSSILEKSLGATLNGFVVTSKRDSDILTALMQRVDW